MIQAKAATVASALISAGYTPFVFLVGTDYRINVTDTQGNVTAAQVNTFATGQGINAFVHSVDFE